MTFLEKTEGGRLSGEKCEQELRLRKIFVLALGLASLSAFAGAQPAVADCRSENAACVKGASSPFDSVACGSLFRTCAANHAIAAQQQATQPQNSNKSVPAAPAASAQPPGGAHPGRK